MTYEIARWGIGFVTVIAVMRVGLVVRLPVVILVGNHRSSIV